MIELADREHCTGCEACRSVCPQGCISMKEDAEGFLHPVIDPASCVGCGLCRRACPVLQEVKAVEADKVYAAWSRDEAVRCGSSSGGVFYELARKVISEGGVVCGAVREGSRVFHRCADSLSGIEAMRGSKYVQSRIGESYREVASHLKAGRQVLFSGTPCQVAGLRASLGPKDHPGLLTIDLVCHGVPSSSLFASYLEQLQKKYGPQAAESFLFRRTDKWSHQPEIRTGGKRRLLSGRDASFMGLYLEGFLFRESCYHCPFARRERVGDLTLGDFWGIGDKVPFEADPSRGCSLVMVGSETGARWLELTGDRLFLRERTLEETLSLNTNLSAPAVRPPQRGDIYGQIARRGFARVYRPVLVRRILRLAYARFHHQLHLLKVQLCRKSA